MVPDLSPDAVRKVLEAALAEDLGAKGDITTSAVISDGSTAEARIVARQALVLAGLRIACETFHLLAARAKSNIAIDLRWPEGQPAGQGDVLATITGDAAVILTGERTCLNLLGRMSGVATVTAEAVREVRGTGVKILDTRKTIPGLRLLDKYAVATGGGENHRRGLFDAVMIKDTHLGVTGSIPGAIQAALAAGHDRSIITAEVRTLEELQQAIDAGAGRALLDNMTLAMLKECVQEGRGRIILEASGGLRPGSLRQVAATGVDCMSLGWLTHSAPNADVAMEIDSGW